MRPVTVTDLCAAARVLLAQPPARRRAAMAALVARAEAAARHRRATGRHHPAYGNGTLLAAALAHPAPDAAPGATDYLACLALALDVLLARPSEALEYSAQSPIFPADTAGDPPCPNSSPS